MNKPIRIALLGLGTVGSGVYKLIHRRAQEMPQIAGAPIEISHILVRNTAKERPGVDSSLLTDNWADIVNDPEVSIVVELMGGMEPAHTYISEALKAGKNVVTANKDLIAMHGGDLLDLAAEHQCDLQFEASVAGAIPIIRPLKQCLAGNEISEIMGIVNGTTNYILTRMTQDNMEFADALAMATELGYAEADPTADIEGYDAGRKVAIMASIAFHSRVTFDDVYTEGITKIQSTDIRYARELGKAIKLLGVACNTEEGIEVRVHPMLIPASHPLATVNDAFNAVFVHGDALDDAMFMGRGAGELPTASAVMGDIIDTARNLLMGCTGRIGCTCYKNVPVKSIDDIRSKYYIRLNVENRMGVLAGVSGVLGNNGVSISQVLQKQAAGDSAELVVITDTVRERHIRDALLILENMSMVHEVSSVIRVY
ncbi:homoserine dehydrogenase [Butyricicoccus sp.]|uniref:homoserine dehydrogenase n=1 Tax=Butyricicoccus sp. TaxID=2049021 RepID=UPI003F13C041